MAKTVFHYDPDTFFLVGSSPADESPLEPGVFLVPAHATTKIPPAEFPSGSFPKWVGGVWDIVKLPVTPPVNMPALSARQIRIALIRNGFLLSAVDAAIDALPEGAERETARVEWEYATTFVRTHPLIAAIGAALDLTDDQINEMWAAAAKL